ncbi:competence protein ComGC [Natronobacillus azotifigens]|uniref:ComG operon protein 3 n=1 Tax=Natronobacillus azotifigens TaxID=472978 RepID=A0A9J6RFA6_9BACI|nr:competence type IV pilus major pilin ComGC [Natronobacillus azotifigens]MCZ0704068.1 competence type IV pilus major pilin ComGC [Natronobacillus azotifigens]
MLKNEKGFTLIEMLIVLSIIATLLILLIPNLADRNEEVHDKGAEALIQMAESQVQLYILDHGRHPDSISTLVSEKYLQTDKLSNGKQKIAFKDTVHYEIIVVPVNE